MTEGQENQKRETGTHKSGAGASYAGAIINIEALREYREQTLWGNWLKDLRTEQYRLIYERPLYEKNLAIERPPLKHAENDEIVRAAVERMFELGIYKRPAK